MSIQLQEKDFLNVGEGKCADVNGTMFSFGQVNGKGTESACRNECGQYNLAGLKGFSVNAALDQCSCYYDKGSVPENWIGYKEEKDGTGMVQSVIGPPTISPTMNPTTGTPSVSPSSLPSLTLSTEPSRTPSSLPSSINAQPSTFPSVIQSSEQPRPPFGIPSGNPISDTTSGNFTYGSIDVDQRSQTELGNDRNMTTLQDTWGLDQGVVLESTMFDMSLESPSNFGTPVCYAYMFPNLVPDPDWDDPSTGVFEDICQDQAGRCSLQIFAILSFIFIPLFAACCYYMRWRKHKTRGQGRDDLYFHDELVIPSSGHRKPNSFFFRSSRSIPGTALSVLTDNQEMNRFANSGSHRQPDSFLFRSSRSIPGTMVPKPDSFLFRSSRSIASSSTREQIMTASPEICQIVGESPAHYDRRLQLFKKRSELWQIDQRKRELANEEKRLTFREDVLLKMEMTMLTNRNNLVFDDLVEKFHLQNVASDLANTNAHGMQASAYANGCDLDERLSSKTSKDVCAVCFNGFRFGEAICAPKTKYCEHVFHPECAEEWLQGSQCCPLCQTNLLGE